MTTTYACAPVLFIKPDRLHHAGDTLAVFFINTMPATPSPSSSSTPRR
jgi:hypothetical protein